MKENNILKRIGNNIKSVCLKTDFEMEIEKAFYSIKFYTEGLSKEMKDKIMQSFYKRLSQITIATIQDAKDIKDLDENFDNDEIDKSILHTSYDEYMDMYNNNGKDFD